MIKKVRNICLFTFGASVVFSANAAAANLQPSEISMQTLFNVSSFEEERRDVSQPHSFPQSVLYWNNEILVSETARHQIRTFKNNQSSVYAGFQYMDKQTNEITGALYNGEKQSALFHYPAGLAKDKTGNIYVADSENHAIRKIHTNGKVATVAGNGELGSMDGVGTQATFYSPQDVAVDSDGTIYVADTLNHSIRKISPEGKVSTLNPVSTRLIEISGYVQTAGDYKDGPIDEAKFNEPSGLAIDSLGNLYVSDTGNHRIRYIDFASNTVETVAGPKELNYGKNSLYAVGGYQDGLASQARFSFPRGLAIDQNGGLLIADSQNHAIRYLYGGQVKTLAGQKDNPGFRDGTETSAQFHMPMDIEIGDDGSLIIADTYNHKIRKLTPFSFPNEFPENENELKVLWNSKLIPFDSPPEIMDGRVMTPIRPISEAIGYEVEFDPTQKKIMLKKQEHQIEFVLGEKEIIKTSDGKIEKSFIDVAPYTKNNRTYLPSRFFAEVAGFDVDWYKPYQTVIIRK